MNTTEILVSEGIIYLIPAIFADFNMAFYPPGPNTAMGRACKIFQEPHKEPLQKMRDFYELRGNVEYGSNDTKCFDLNLELPHGHHARIMGADWTGSGGSFSGEIWEFQCCKDKIVQTGYGPNSMFIPRKWTLSWLRGHCQDRFPGIPMDPFRMVRQWGFDDLSGASRIFFANGNNDGWATASITESDNPNIAIINFPNGAHHSELGNVWPRKYETNDIQAGYDTITTILGKWLSEIQSEMTK